MNVVARAALLTTMLAAMVVGSLAAWSRGGHPAGALWRLDVGPPNDTRLHPFHDAGARTSATAGCPAGNEPIPTRLAIAGDVGTGDRYAFRTGRAIDRLESDGQFAALLLLGDSVYPSGAADEVDAKVFEPFGGVLDGPTELTAALGNHDVRIQDGEPLMAALDMPGRWYARRYGPVRVIVVDSNRATDRDQLDWLDEELDRATDATWTVVLQHHPPYSAGHHGSHDPSRQELVPRYRAAGVALVFSGHDHDYQRTHPQDGVTYVVSGGAAKLRPTGSAEFTVTAASTHHFVELVADGDRLQVRAIRSDGGELDSFALAAPDGRSGCGR